jgi:radical SAM superfamily enzyme YgiQ (UPF0313 family)
MDILLIYPPLSVNERYGNRKLGSIGGYLPYLGVAYIAAFLREADFKVGIIDAPVLNLQESDILQEIEKLRPKVIGISAITPVFHRAVRLAEAIKRQFPDILILLGGHHASILPVEVLQDNQAFDIVVYGEGEITALEIMSRYKEHGFDKNKFLNDIQSLRNILGIGFSGYAGEITITPARKPIEDLDKLPYPAWDLLPMHKYIPLPNQYLRKPVVHMVAIRGCPYQCSFCSNNSVFGRKIRAVSPARLVNIIKYAKARFGAREISFWDDSMTVDKKWMVEFCRIMIEEDLDITWTCYSRVDTVSKDILFLMKRAGCWNIFYGYESGNQELLDIIGKNITLEQIKQVNQWTKDAGIEVRASFMIAMPGETPEMAKKTIDFAISLEPDYAQFSVTTPFPKTKLYEDASRYGVLVKEFSKYNLWDPIFIPHGYKDKKQIELIERMAVRRFYFRFRYIWGRLRKIRSWEDILRYIKGLEMAIGFTTP